MKDHNLLPIDGTLCYIDNFLDDIDSAIYFEKLANDIKWKSQEIMMFGKKVMQPRLTALYGDKGAAYKYSGTLFEPTPWIQELLQIKKKVEDYTQADFNVVLLNLYRDGSDYMGFHSDNEKELGDEPVIASLSLGASRMLKFQHKINKEMKVSLELGDGSLNIMSGEMQQYWKHSIPKTKKVLSSRINLTFRKVY